MTSEEKWREEFYNWFKDSFSIDGNMVELVELEMFNDMKYSYLECCRKRTEEQRVKNEVALKALDHLVTVANLESRVERDFKDLIAYNLIKSALEA